MWYEWNYIQKSLDICPEKQCVYKLRILDDSKKPFQIKYPFDINNEGIIYIGQTFSMIETLSKLLWINIKNYNHNQFKSFCFISLWENLKLDRYYKRKNLQVSWRVTNDSTNLKNIILYDHKIKYGCIPICNISFYHHSFNIDFILESQKLATEIFLRFNIRSNEQINNIIHYYIVLTEKEVNRAIHIKEFLLSYFQKSYPIQKIKTISFHKSIDSHTIKISVYKL